MALLSRIKSWLFQNGTLPQAESNDDALVLAGRHQATLIKGSKVDHLADAEFKVFSQAGDDGIIQYLIRQVPVSVTSFIEFGVENYNESNTRFLLMNNNWKGLIMDGGEEHMNYVKRQPWYWRYDLTAVAAFIKKENINELFKRNGFSGPVGILSIDIDGNDYWVWEAIKEVEPDIVIAEYNSVFGSRYAVTIPYDPEFNRTQAHYSNLYWGTSLKALAWLGEKKGYAFVGCNQNGNNAYFVKKSKLGLLRPLSIENGYVESRYRESRDRSGQLTYLSGNERLKMIEEKEIIEVTSNKAYKIKELYSA